MTPDPAECAAEPASTLVVRQQSLHAWHQKTILPSAPDLHRLHALYDRPRFAGARDTATGGWTRFWEWLWAWMTELLTARPTQSFASGTRFLVLVLAGGVVLFGLYRYVRRKRVPRTLTSTRSPAAHLALTLHEPQVHLTAAAGLVESHPREALREALLALLSMLEAARWARPDRVKTNRELAGELQGRGAPGPVAEKVKGLLGWYDGVFYSLGPVPPPEARRFLEQVGQLQSQVARRVKNLRLYLLYALLLVGAAFAALSSRAPPSQSTLPSVDNPSPEGLEVLFTYLREGGSKVEAWHQALTALPFTARTLVLAAPTAQTLTETEVERLRTWVAQGGTLIYLTPARGELKQPPLTRWLELEVGPVRPVELSRGPELTSLVNAEGPFTGLHRLRISSLRGLTVGHREAVPVAAADSSVLLWYLPWQRGEVYLVAGTELAQNRCLESADNLAFWQAISARGPLYFDETHLTPGPPPAPSRALNATFLQLAILSAVVFWARGIRLGPPRVRGVGKHRSSREYLDSFGWLLRRGHVERELTQALHRRVRRHLWEEGHIPLHLSDEEAALQWAQQTGQPPDRLRDWAAAASATGSLTPAQFARLSREAAALESVRRR